MKILHTYCLNYNLGDYALGYGLKSLLREHLPVDLIADTNIQGQLFNKYYIDEVVNKKYDLLVIGGGGIIHGSHWPNGWFWLIDFDLIKSIKIPFIVYGVGNNYWEEEGKIANKTIDHLNETKARSTFFSVRNDGSYDRLLQQTGIDADVVPDPGFHINRYSTFERTINEKYVIVQLAFDKPSNRFRADKVHLDNFIKDFRQVILKLSKSYKIVFCPHVFDDIIISKEIMNGIENTYLFNFGDFAFDKSYIPLGLYKHAEFVIAMRGHGQIVPLSFNVPVISIQNHPKHLGLMKELNLTEYNISIDDVNFKSKLLNIIDNVEINFSNIKSFIGDINKDLNKSSDLAFNKIKGKLDIIK